MQRPVRVGHSLFIGSHMTKNRASALLSYGVVALKSLQEPIQNDFSIVEG
jgi:hypothetical protein